MATVEAVLSRKGSVVYHVDSDWTVLDAARRMNEHGVGGLVVLDAGRLAGIFTERDILRRVVAAGLDPATTKVREVMTSPVTVCGAATPLDDCRDLMTTRRIRHLPVYDGRQLLGIITIGDILAHRTIEQHEEIQYLSTYMFGGR
jgi:CBS domain-containing protein